MRSSRSRYLLLLIIPLLWCVFGHSNFLENRLLDLRFIYRGELKTPLKIVYVDIDNEAIQAY